MSFNIEKLKQIAKPCDKRAKEIANQRRQNREWLKMSQDIALLVHYHLRNSGMSQKILAEKMDVSPTYISRLLKGKENLTLETINKLQSALNQNIISIAHPYISQQVCVFPTKSLAVHRQQMQE